MILVSDKEILFLKLLLIQNNSKIFDYSNKNERKEINSIFEDSTFIIIKKNNSFYRVDNQSNIESEKGELLLFRIRKNKNSIYILENPLSTKISEDNSDILNIKLWFVIKPPVEILNEIKYVNEDYYLNEYDIIKFGNIKYIVLEINIKSIKDNNDNNDNYSKEDTINEETNNYYDIGNLNKNTGLIFDFYQKPKEFYESLDENYSIKCYICNENKCSKENPIVKFCKCNYSHFECLRSQIKTKTISNKDNSVKNYYIRYLTCKKCKCIYPLKFKISDKKFEFFQIEKPNNDYLILESIEPNYFYGHIKIIHVIELNDNKNINIGRNREDNDVIISEPSVSRKHAFLNYNKEERKILMKNISHTFGTLVLIKKSLEIKENIIQIEIGKVFIEAKTMTFGEFEKNKHTKYPLPKKDD